MSAPDAARRTDHITGRAYLERGQPVVVLIRWRGKGPRNVLIRRADGTQVVRPFRGLRRVEGRGHEHLDPPRTRRRSGSGCNAKATSRPRCARPDVLTSTAAARHQGGGKAVHIVGWVKGGFTPDVIRSWARTRPQDTNTGFLTGAVCAVDGDIPDAALAARVDALADQRLGPTPLRRIGRAPKWLRCYRAEAPMQKMETPERRLNGETVQVEIMGKGQQIAAYGVHPATMQPVPVARS